MTTKIKHQATVSSGKVLTRSSKRMYSHAWAFVKEDGNVFTYGFSGSYELAKKSANSYLQYVGYKSSEIEIVEAIAA
jgi:hypothetical protein